MTINRRSDQTKVGGPRTRALFDVTSFDEKAKTVQITLTTEQAVKMYNYDIGYFNEILQCDKASIRAERLNNGLPVLDNHNRWESVAENTLGIVESWDVVGGKLTGTVRFSEREEIQSFVKDVQNGIIRSVSVGYRVHKYLLENPGGDSELPTYRAVDWEPMEVSFVQVAADSQATTRGKEEQEPNNFIVVDKDNNVVQIKSIIKLKNEIMDPKELEAAKTAERQRCLDINAAVKAAGLEQSVADKFIQEDKTLEQVKAAIKAIEDSIRTASETTGADVAKKIQERNVEIRDAVKAAGLGDDYALELIMAGKTADEARKDILAKFAKQDPNDGVKGANATVQNDVEDKIRERMADAIHLRANMDIIGVNLTNERKEAAREFRMRSMLDMCRLYLEHKSVDCRMLSNREIAHRALTNSDFPYILANALNKTLRRAYELAPKTFMPFVRRVDAKDFKPMSVTQLSGLYRGFEKINEGGEYKSSKMTDSAENYGIAKYGEMIKITWEAIINDDMSAFTRVGPAFAENSAQLQSNIVYAILLGGTSLNMSDGIPLFQAADHKNYISSGTDIDDTSIGVMRQKIREQTSPDGKILNLEPSFLIVGPTKENKAYKYTSADFVPNTQANIPNTINKTLTTIVDGRITGNGWFMMCNPSRIDTIQISYLEGEEEVFTESKWGFETDCFMMKARTEFGAAPIDHRGMIYNVGA